MTTTAKELAIKLGVDYAIANSLLRLLEAKGLTSVDAGADHPKTAGRGRPTKVYKVPDYVIIRMDDGKVETT
jgi:predicted ArsR family transcriptional regulator